VKTYTSEVISFFTERGGRSRAKLPWEDMDRKVVSLTQVQGSYWEDIDDVWVKDAYIRQHGDPTTNGKGHQVTLRPKGHEAVLAPRRIPSLRRKCGTEAHLTQTLDVGGFALGGRALRAEVASA